MTGNRLVSDRLADLIAAMGTNANSASRAECVGAVVGNGPARRPALASIAASLDYSGARSWRAGRRSRGHSFVARQHSRRPADPGIARPDPGQGPRNFAPMTIGSSSSTGSTASRPRSPMTISATRPPCLTLIPPLYMRPCRPSGIQYTGFSYVPQRNGKNARAFQRFGAGHEPSITLKGEARPYSTLACIRLHPATANAVKTVAAFISVIWPRVIWR